MRGLDQQLARQQRGPTDAAGDRAEKEVKTEAPAGLGRIPRHYGGRKRVLTQAELDIPPVQL
jgi:hypothetical protein